MPSYQASGIVHGFIGFISMTHRTETGGRPDCLEASHMSYRPELRGQELCFFVFVGIYQNTWFSVQASSVMHTHHTYTHLWA